MRLVIVGRTGPRSRPQPRSAAAGGAAGAASRVVRGRCSSSCAPAQGADLLLIEAGDEIAAAIDRLARERIFLPVVAYGIDCPPHVAAAAIKAGARDFLPLPPDAGADRGDPGRRRGRRQELVCVDPRMAEVLAQARQYAAANACVLITGESGTGKEMMARFLHRHGRRSRGPFVAVNCAAIPDNLLESELFGHERGAFTGAVARRVGRFEEAQGGTLLLDEISEMEPRLQAKLLRAIQEREIDRVGGSRPVRVDIRLIATSNRDLERAVAEGCFREDLLFRLNVLTLQLPPLRERPQDIVALAGIWRPSSPASTVCPSARSARRHWTGYVGLPWRGNVRELENCLHRAVILARGDIIEPEDIQPSAHALPSRRARARPAPPPGSAGPWPRSSAC